MFFLRKKITEYYFHGIIRVGLFMKKQVTVLTTYALFFFLISLVIVGDFTLESLVLCALISIVSAIGALVAFKTPTKLDIHILDYLQFAIKVITSIYTSTFSTVACYIRKKGKIPTAIETIPLCTKSGFARLFICQSITLTPGTVSINSKAGSVTVLKIKTESLDDAKKFDAILGKNV